MATSWTRRLGGSYHRYNNILHTYITVEPVIFLFMLADYLIHVTSQGLIYEKVCLDKFNKSICDNLTGHKAAEDAVQSDSSVYILINLLCTTLPAIFTAQIMGSWSDKYGRRIVMCFPFVGQIIATLGYLINSIYLRARIEFVFIGILAGSMLGGFTTALMTIYSYLACVVEKKERTFRNAIVYGIMLLSRAISGFVSGIILDNTSFEATFGVSAAVFGLGILYIAVWLRPVEEQTEAEEPESKDSPEGDTIQTVSAVTEKTTVDSVANGTESEEHKEKPEKKNCCSSLFNFETITGSVRCFTKKRLDNRRFQLNLQMFALLVCAICFGSAGVEFLYLKASPRSFTPTMYGFFASVSSIVRCICLLVLVPILKKVFNASDTILSIIGVLSFSLSNWVLALSEVQWMAFLSAAIGVMGHVTFTCLRSIMSCMVEPEEQGKMFALVASLQSLASVTAQPLFNLLYPATLAWFPGFVFALSGTMQLIPMSMIIVLHIQLRKYPLQGINEPRAVKPQVTRVTATQQIITQAYVLKDMNTTDGSALPTQLTNYQLQAPTETNKVTSQMYTGPPAYPTDCTAL